MRNAAACLLLSLAVALATAAIAIACTPMAFLTIDRPSYGPGEPFTVSGAQFDPEAATPVTLRWGDGGPVIGSAPVGADGSVSFSGTVPADATAGTYVLYAEAYGADGQMVPGLPTRVSLPVAAAVAPAPVVPAPAAPAPVAPPVSEEAAAPEETRQPAPARSDPQPPARSRAEAPPRVATPAPPPPAAATPPAPVVAATVPSAPEAVTTGTAPTRTNVIRHRAPGIERAPLPRSAEPGDAPALPVIATAVDRPGGTPWSVLVLGGLALLALGGAAGALATGPTRPPAPPIGDMDAALQELIAEERAKQPEPSERR